MYGCRCAANRKKKLLLPAEIACLESTRFRVLELVLPQAIDPAQRARTMHPSGMDEKRNVAVVGPGQRLEAAVAAPQGVVSIVCCSFWTPSGVSITRSFRHRRAGSQRRGKRRPEKDAGGRRLSPRKRENEALDAWPGGRMGGGNASLSLTEKETRARYSSN